MKYIVFDERKDGTGDVFNKEFSTKEAAIQEAKSQWNRLTASEKKKRTIYVIESTNPDEDAEDHLDGEYVWRCEA